MSVVAVALLLAAEISVPVCEVVEQTDPKASVYPGRVVPIAQVDVIQIGSVMMVFNAPDCSGPDEENTNS